MRITTPTHIEQVAWEGYLEPLAESYSISDPRPRVTLGEPVSWPVTEALASKTGQAWTPPADGRRYVLVRLACTLHPFSDTRTRYTEATLNAYLQPARGSQPVVAHDLYPTRLTAETKGTLNVSLGPELKFAQLVEGKVAEAGAEIEYRQVFPVIQSYGLSESSPYWQFAHHATHPLLGSQCVYLVLAIPPRAGSARLIVAMNATLETRFGPIRLKSPQEASADHLTWTIDAH